MVQVSSKDSARRDVHAAVVVAAGAVVVMAPPMLGFVLLVFASLFYRLLPGSAIWSWRDIVILVTWISWSEYFVRRSLQPWSLSHRDLDALPGKALR